MPSDGRSLEPLETPIGTLWAAATAVGVLAVHRGEDPGEMLAFVDRFGVELSPSMTAEARSQLAAFLEGERRAFTVPLDLRGVAAFDAAVYGAAVAVPFGATASYGELAMAAGTPGAARAAGNAMARCRLSPIVPCHRVIRADGSIGGWGPDLWVKRWLLAREGFV